jgi:hypothetical protein
MLLISAWTLGQNKPTYYADIEPILRKNCVSCHKPAGIAPFSLQTYEEVAAKGNFIGHVTKTKYMPPWKADPSYQTYRNETKLTKEEIDIIQQWIFTRLTKGKKMSPKKIVNKSENEKETIPDLVLPMVNSYQLKDNAQEDFRFFVIPTNLTEDKYLSAVEFIPGNRRQVHHSRVMVDSSQAIRGIDGMSEMDMRVKEFQTIPLADEFLYGWVPGNTKIFFPPGTGKKIKKESDLILNIHYSPTSKLEADRSTVNLYYSRSNVNREVQTLTLKESDIKNQPFFIERERTPSFYIDYPIYKDISLISIMPHMHFIGKSFIAYAITLEEEKIPLIKIDEWDFNWQTMYQFKKMVKIPAGSRIIVEAKFDNTSENPVNPNHPAKDIGYGWNSTDEMCDLVMYFLDYFEGDENIEY